MFFLKNQIVNTPEQSDSGFHQGDPLASLLFALALQPIVRIISERIPDLLVHVWYLDDGSIVGSAVQLRQVVDIVQELGPPRGLHLSCPKSTVWCPSAAMEASRGADQEHGTEDEPGRDPLNRGIPLVLEPGIVLLGAPVGSESPAWLPPGDDHLCDPFNLCQ